MRLTDKPLPPTAALVRDNPFEMHIGTYGTAYKLRADAYEMLGKKDLAISDLKEALAISRDFQDAETFDRHQARLNYQNDLQEKIRTLENEFPKKTPSRNK
jgi:tetratricopeptide (TPR) repeat protein